MSSRIDRLIVAEGLPADYRSVVEQHWRPLGDRIADLTLDKQPLLIGINGAQGSGKTTLCLFLEALLTEHGQRTVTLSLDDLYLTRAERGELAANEHPLFATRGVPGTHDIALAEVILDDLLAGRTAALPRFEKAADDRAPMRRMVEPRIDVVLFEGWCVGALPQPAAALRAPANALERDEDADGVWRREVNRRLATDYAELFSRIDLLVMLEVEGFEAARANRRLQEDKLAASHPGAAGIMDAAALDRFLMHYERLTRWMLEEMPVRADVVIGIGKDQRPIEDDQTG
jgi:D-glycerate 3-kinase